MTQCSDFNFLRGSINYSRDYPAKLEAKRCAVQWLEIMLGDNLYLENIQEYVQDEDKIVSLHFICCLAVDITNCAKLYTCTYE